MKFSSHSKHKRTQKSKRSSHKASEPMGLIQSAAIACGAGLACEITSALIFSLIALICGFGSGIISALGYFSSVLTFAICGFVAGRRGRAAIPSGVLAACGMTLISVLLSFLPISSGATLSAIAVIFIRLGLAAISVIFAIIGSNK